MNVYNKILQAGFYPEDLKLGMASDAAVYFKSAESLPEKHMYETYTKLRNNVAYSKSSLNTVFLEEDERQKLKQELSDVRQNIEMALALLYESDSKQLDLALSLIYEAKEGVINYCKHQPMLARKLKESTALKHIDTIVEDALLAYKQTSLLDLTN